MDWFKKNAIASIMAFLTTIMAAIVMLMITSVVAELKSKVSKKEAEEIYIKKTEAASINYVKEAFRSHETREQIIVEGVKDAISSGNKNIEKILNIHINNVDKRLQRLENK